MAVDELLVIEVLDAHECVDGVVGVDVEHVLYGPSFGVLGPFGYFIDFQPVAASLLCEEEHGVVHGGGIDVLYEVLVARLCSLRAYSTAVLCVEFAERCALDVSHVADGDDHFVVGIEVFGVEFL